MLNTAIFSSTAVFSTLSNYLEQSEMHYNIMIEDDYPWS